MSDEIDISKLHGDIKKYALACERDSKNSKGYGKLNTQYEIKLFKEMVIKAGKQKELKAQLPNIKGVDVIADKEKEQNINKRIVDLMKDREGITTPDEIRNVVAEKFELKKKQIK